MSQSVNRNWPILSNNLGENFDDYEHFIYHFRNLYSVNVFDCRVDLRRILMKRDASGGAKWNCLRTVYDSGLFFCGLNADAVRVRIS